MFIKKYLDNSIPVVMECIEGVQSVAIGIWIKVGSRNESQTANGISHFIEHMLFKGTKNRTQKDIAIEIDSVGGDLNAYTSRENTSYYVKVLSEFTPLAIDLLSDIFLNSVFAQEEIDKEKEVIKEEIKGIDDTPDDLIYDLFYSQIWGDRGLGLPITGTIETVSAFTRRDIDRHMETCYGSNDVVISCAGNIDHEEVYRMLNRRLGGFIRNSSEKPLNGTSFQPGLRVYDKDLSEVHVCVGFKCVNLASRLRYPFLILNAILGLGVSSRLFQEVREKRGLVYTIQSYLSLYHDTGIFGIYTAAGEEKYVEVVEATIEQVNALKGSVTEAELRRAKNQLKGYLILALESSSGRMNNIAKQEIYYGRYYSPDEAISEIERIELKDIEEIIEEYLDIDKAAIAALGNAEEDALMGVIP